MLLTTFTQAKSMIVQVGEKAPCFTLYDSEKNKISLSDYNGKKNVLLLFFPLAFTSVCTVELCTVRDNIHKYENENVQVLGISVDSVYSLAKYKQEQQFSYPLISDFNREASSAYNVLYPSFSAMEMKGVSKRSAFIIDKAGIIQYAEVLEKAPDLPDFQAIVSKIQELLR
ncbi:MAG: redoxin domain-containing protein [Ferruginibacter sp.]